MTTSRGALCGVLLLMLGSSCLSSVPPQTRHYYHLPGARPAKERADGPRVAVRDLAPTAGYESAKLVYRVSPHEIRYYEYRQWVAEPGRLLADMTARHLRSSGYFADVEAYDKLKDPQLVVEGTVEAFEEVDGKTAWEAHLAVNWVVRRVGSDRVLLRHGFDVRRACDRDNSDAIVDALGSILAEQAQELARRIVQSYVVTAKD
jgi:ABC-type uncharacterized transport system auxiliary subunit